MELPVRGGHTARLDENRDIDMFATLHERQQAFNNRSPRCFSRPSRESHLSPASRPWIHGQISCPASGGRTQQSGANGTRGSRMLPESGGSIFK